MTSKKTLQDLKESGNNEFIKMLEQMNIIKEKEQQEIIDMIDEIILIKYKLKSEVLKHIMKSNLKENQKLVVSSIYAEFSAMRSPISQLSKLLSGEFE